MIGEKSTIPPVSRTINSISGKTNNGWIQTTEFGDEFKPAKQTFK
jgi:hypothetical protein